MFNLLRMDLFRMVHTKSVVIVFVLLMGFSIISGCMSSYDSVEYTKQIKEQAETGKKNNAPVQEDGNEDVSSGESLSYDVGYEVGEQAGANLGIYMETPIKDDGSLCDYLVLYCEELSSGIMLLFIIIASVTFFNGDEKNGFIKNIAGQVKHRYNIFLAKFLTIGIFTFLCMVCYMLVELSAFKCSWLIGYDIGFGMEYIPEAIKAFALAYLLYMAFISGLLLLTEVTKSTAAGITMGMLALFGFGDVFSLLFQKIFHTSFDISEYYINTKITGINIDMGMDAVKSALVLGFIFLILYSVLHIFYFTKKDVV